MLMIGLAKSADIIHYLKEMMLAPSAGVHGRSKMLQIIKLPLTIMDILFPDATIKVVKQISLLCSTTNYNPSTKEKS